MTVVCGDNYLHNIILFFPGNISATNYSTVEFIFDERERENVVYMC